MTDVLFVPVAVAIGRCVETTDGEFALLGCKELGRANTVWKDEIGSNSDDSSLKES